MRATLLIGWTAVVTGAQICHVPRSHAILGLYHSWAVSRLHCRFTLLSRAFMRATLLIGWTAVVTGAQICHVHRSHAVLGLHPR